jgi:hypothetical protein
MLSRIDWGWRSPYFCQPPVAVRPTSGPWRKGSPPIERTRKKVRVMATNTTGIVQTIRRSA